MYSLRKRKARLLFLQFKNGEKNKKGNYIQINEKQMLLFSSFPAVSCVGKGFCPHDILQDKIHGAPQSGAMFCIIEYDSVMKKYNLRFLNHTMLNLPRPCLTTSKSGSHSYNISSKTKRSAVSSSTLSLAFTYCDYVPSFSDFMDNVKKLEIGREIDMADISIHMPEEAMPKDLKEYCNKNEIGNINHDSSDALMYHVDTIALNVDELV